MALLTALLFGILSEMGRLNMDKHHLRNKPTFVEG